MKSFFVLFFALFLVGCGTVNTPTPTPQCTTVISAAPHVVPPEVAPLNVSPIQWHVYNTADLQGLLDAAKKAKQEIVIFTVDEANFKLLNDNLVDIKRYLEQQGDVVIFLTKAANAPADAADATVSSTTNTNGKK